MTDRRTFLATSAAATLALAGKAGASPIRAADDKTWLTYAVNIEMTFNNLPVLERLKKVKEAGFSHYEFWPYKGKDIDAMIALNKELGLTPVQFSAFWGITDPKKKDAFIQAIKDSIPVAKKLGVKMICVVAGEKTDGMTDEDQDNAVIDALKAGAELVEPEGITIILEPLNILVNHPGQHVVTSAHAARIIDAVGSKNVKILFDIYHQQISEGNLTGNIRKYKDKIGYFQLADHPGRNEPGTGEINYAHVLKVVHDTGYDKPIGLEMSPKGDPMKALQAVREVDARAKAMES